MNIKIDVGNKIKEVRKLRGISQKQLGDSVGSNQEHISKVEAGKINLTLEYISKIAECLKVEIKILFELIEK